MSSRTLQQELDAFLAEEVELKEENDKRFSDLVDTLGADEIKAMMKRASPYAPPVENADKKRSYSFSYTNYRMDFAQKYNMTALIAFLFRSLEELEVPTEVPAVSIEDYLEDPTCVNISPELAAAGSKNDRLIRLYDQYKQTMDERVVVWRFLKRVLDFNPDIHVKSSYKGNTKDPSRKVVESRSIKKAIAFPNTVARETPKDYQPTLEDLKNATKVDDLKDDVAKRAWKNVPSADTFAKLKRYSDEHHEQLLEITNDIHGLKPDIDSAIIIYKDHNSRKGFDKYKNKIMDQVVASVTNIREGHWALLGPYRENRERIDFLSKKTEVLKAMLDKREEDSKIMDSIMKKRIHVESKKNAAEMGPADAGFKKWLKKNKPDIAKMGGISVEEDEDLCPKDCVEVNVFTAGSGGQKLHKNVIYNKTEAPTERKESKESAQRVHFEDESNTPAPPSVDTVDSLDSKDSKSA